MEEKLDFDCELMRPIKDNFEVILNRLLGYVSTVNKVAEITLKIIVDTEKHYDYKKDEYGISKKTNEWIEPKLKFKITEKIKETKSEQEYEIGDNYEIEIKDNNIVYIKEVNKQLKIED